MRQLPLKEQIENYKPIVRGDLNLIDQSDGVVAILTGDPTVGTLMEMFYTKLNLKPLITTIVDSDANADYSKVMEHTLADHPWIRYVSSIILPGVKNLSTHLAILKPLKKIRPLTGIGFVGTKYSGKNTAADYLTGKYNFKQFALADEMKIISKRVWDFKDKDLVDKPEHVRKTLQTLGTDAFRTFWPSAWTDLLIKRIKRYYDLVPHKYSRVAVTDVRFPNEAWLLKEQGFRIVRLFRDTGQTDTHSSETSVSQIRADYEIDNNGTKEDLYNEIETMLLRWGGKLN